ncbi:MAG: RsmD family RNA methyltransferase [Bacteriovoracaceae bacterium]|nr:RsmD family RNA methyltransferase [Bacteriovoracaceae bacterium]
MSLQILGGRAAGFTIELPAQVNFRPTSVMLRRKLFDAHQDWSQESFFDVCAGSGALGMEAYSRGAQSFFGERDALALKLLAKNFQALQKRLACTESAPAIFNTKRALDFGLGQIRPQFALTLFFDPPYELLATLLPAFLTAVQQQKILWQEIWIESDRQKGLPAAVVEAQARQTFSSMIAQSKIVTSGTNFVVKLRSSNNNASSL